MLKGVVEPGEGTDAPKDGDLVRSADGTRQTFGLSITGMRSVPSEVNQAWSH